MQSCLGILLYTSENSDLCEEADLSGNKAFILLLVLIFFFFKSYRMFQILNLFLLSVYNFVDFISGLILSLGRRFWFTHWILETLSGN